MSPSGYSKNRRARQHQQNQLKAFMSGVYTQAREQGDFRRPNPLTGLRLQKIEARRAKKMPFNPLAENASCSANSKCPLPADRLLF